MHGRAYRMRTSNVRLRTLRRELGLDCRDCARQIGISYHLYLDYESARALPRTAAGDWKDSARRIAEFHGLGLEWLWPPELQGLTEVARAIDAASVEVVYCAASPLNPEECLLRRGDVRRLQQAIARLPVVERDVILQRQHGAELREIGRLRPGGRDWARSVEMGAVASLRRDLRTEP